LIKTCPFAIALAIAVLSLGACGKPQGQMQGGPVEVGVIVLRPQTTALTVELPGRTSAIETSDVRPQVSGIVQARLFTEGSDVRRGQVLYHIDPATYRAALAQAQGQLANARAVLTSARLKAQRYADRVKINAVSKQEADDATAAFQQASAAVQQAQASVQSASINLGYTRVKAPISGHIGASTVTRGALVTADQATALTTIQRTDRMYVDITQSASELMNLRQQLQSGALGRGGVAVRLRLDNGVDYDQTGTLQFTDVTVDQGTGAVTLRAVFPNPRGVLLPGLYVRALVDQGVRANAILAPQTGVQRDLRGDPIAMVANAKGKAEQRELKLGPSIGDKWLVLSGLQGGDRLIVEGVQKVKPGAPLKVVPAGSPSGPSAAQAR
jgi:membrane fusion protein (multidrug efflux system)